MEKNQMKNIVVLKNLPSNLVEEAILIFKSKKSAKEFQYIDKKEKVEKQSSVKNDKNYIVREAESVISNYINTIENKEKKPSNTTVNKKYRMLKIYSIIVTILLIVSRFI